MSNKNVQINRLQENLSAIRKIAGWTTEQFGEKIGVSKQTISNLENRKTPMSLSQYIAIRTVIDYEVHTNMENPVLQQVVELLVDRGDEFTEEKRKDIVKNINILAATAAGGMAGMPLISMSALLLKGILPAVAIAGTAIGISSWVVKLLKNK